ncbi:hypothetical protein BSKO_09894 [Bryopsis sp. KO-2023]|nr:hypothetical protein BSKO_09894 [Bryopsis sp. KO-2023]
MDGKIALPITSLYGGLLGGAFLWMSLRVANFRRGNKISIGTGGNKQFEHLMRGHGNFVEYTPFFMMLLVIAEVDGFAGNWLYVLGGLFSLGRLLHAAFFFFRAPMFCRFYGMIATLLPTSILSALLVFRGVMGGSHS